MVEPERMSDAIDVSDRTKFAMPIRNLISLIASVAVGVWAYFGIIERLNRIETNNILMQADLIKNTEFRIKWVRYTVARRGVYWTYTCNVRERPEGGFCVGGLTPVLRALSVPARSPTNQQILG